mgnify:CR=1 FL=1
MFSFYLLGLKKILSLLKKAFIILVVYFVIISLFLYFLNKDRVKVSVDPIEKNRQEIYKVINDPSFKNDKEGQIAIAFYRGIFCVLIGEGCTDNPKDGDKNFNYSVFGFISNLIIFPYVNQPASGIYWAYYGLQNAGFIPKTYAVEGIGFSAIQPISTLWKIFRDFSYMILVIILIAIGFMIMFRAKTNAQTIITVENSLPKIVVSLLLITFSFAIVGFLIDLMYVLIGFTVSFLYETEENLTDKFLKAITGGSGSLLSEILSFNFYNAANGFIDLFPPLIKLIIYTLTTSLSVYLVNFILMGKILGAPKIFNTIPAYGGVLAFIVETLLLLAISPLVAPFFLAFLLILTAVFLFFRIFFLLLTHYIELLIYTIFSPLILMIESIPGRSTFSFWFKRVFFNIFVFYLVFILLTVTKLIGDITLSSGQRQLWQPPLFDNVGYENFHSIVVLGFMFIIPNIINFLKQNLLGIKDTGIGFGLGTFFGGTAALFAGAKGGLGLFTSFTQAPFIGPRIQEFAKEGKSPIARLIKKGLGESQAEAIGKETAKAIAKILANKNP